LSGSEAAFRWQDMMVFQIQLTRRNDIVPITRGYMEKCEKALAMHEIAHGPAAEPSRAKPRRSKKIPEQGK
jgi:cyclopropane-fatty-acyl-phospholipid synthase